MPPNRRTKLEPLPDLPVPRSVPRYHPGPQAEMPMASPEPPPTHQALRGVIPTFDDAQQTLMDAPSQYASYNEPQQLGGLAFGASGDQFSENYTPPSEMMVDMTNPGEVAQLRDLRMGANLMGQQDPANMRSDAELWAPYEQQAAQQQAAIMAQAAEAQQSRDYINSTIRGIENTDVGGSRMSVPEVERRRVQNRFNDLADLELFEGDSPTDNRGAALQALKIRKGY